MNKRLFRKMLLINVLCLCCYCCFANAFTGHKNAIYKINSNAVVSTDTITMIRGNVLITMDPLKDNTITEYPIAIKFKINYQIRNKMAIKVVVESLQPLQTIRLFNDGLDTAFFDAADWGAKGADSTIVKTIKISLQQNAKFTDEQTLVLHLKDIKTNFIVRLMPDASKSKGGISNLVKAGDAEIVSRRVGISHYYGNKLNSIDSIQLSVKIYGKYKETNNVLSFALLDTSLNKHFKIWPNPDTITCREWENAIATYRVIQSKRKAEQNDEQETDTVIGLLDVPLKIITTGLNDSLNNVSYIDLILNGQNHIHGGSQKIRLSIKDKPFWAEVGTNFDLLDKIKTNNFYAGVYMFDKDIARIGGKKGENNISFTGGVYESQSLSTRSTSASGLSYRDLSSVHRDTGTLSANTSVKSIGILFSPHLKLTDGKTDANGLHMFLSFYTELLWQTINTNFDYSKIGKKDSIVATANLPMPISKYPYKENSLSYDFRSHYFGFGIPIYIREKEFNLYVNPVFGISNQKFYVNAYKSQTAENNEPLTQNYVTNLTFLNPNGNWNGFYLVQYRLNEVAYGLTFSGEVRGLLLRSAKPVVTLALSKKFDLSALLKPLVAPF
ncbi:MAG: hypothetical protein JWR12_621 [Mucilaginibacter sp.]|nr:hypothetical protein [Mucilaginibacter sp.]